tara:strand:- start:7462 stop:8079 length:618 start_codon:yes stop_codon:yes gene_type:complete
MKDWRTLDKDTILTGKDENGNRYLSQFLKEYERTFQPDMINAGCQRCLDDYYNKFLKYLNTMGTKKVNDSGYVLKSKYDGIPLEFGSQTFVRNSTITREQGDQLIKNHKRGAELFEKVPEPSAPADTDPSKELKKLTRDDLNAQADALGLDGASYANKDEVVQAILDKQAEPSAPADTDTANSNDVDQTDTTDSTDDPDQAPVTE